jgi:hypothetical protein
MKAMINGVFRGSTKNWSKIQYKQYQTLIGRHNFIGIEIEISCLSEKGKHFVNKLPCNQTHDEYHGMIFEQDIDHHLPGVFYKSWITLNTAEITFLFDVSNPIRFFTETEMVIRTLAKHEILCLSTHVNFQVLNSNEMDKFVTKRFSPAYRMFFRCHNLKDSKYRVEIKHGPAFISARDFRSKLLTLTMFLKYHKRARYLELIDQIPHHHNVVSNRAYAEKLYHYYEVPYAVFYAALTR